MSLVTLELVGESALRIRLQKTGEKVDKAVSAGVQAGAIHLVSYIKNELLSGQVLNRRSGNLSRSITYRMASPTVGEVVVGGTAPYGRFQEFGVNHSWEIVPKSKKALCFVVNGEKVIVRKVTHPGLKEKSFMRRGLREDSDAITQIIENKVRGAVQ